MSRIAVAMSGGVDSAVAAALLVEEGWEVIGITMNLWPSWLPTPEAGSRTCCGITAIEDARATARRIGIRHYVLNLREAFERAVIDYFVDEYARGCTPNPCIACNQAIKFRVLLEKVEGLGCQALATGHYARIVCDEAAGRHLLLRAADPRKDQSYVLFALTQAQLARLRFPVGGYAKDEVRDLARRLGLPVSDKPDSQEICFVPTGHYGDLVAARRPAAARPGPILDRTGMVLGTHGGIARYTVGQRRGLGVGGGGPRYVVDIDPERNAVVVGGPDDLLCPSVLLGRVNWIVPPPPPPRVTVRVRHAAADVPAVLRLRDDGRVLVEFEAPQRAVAPGQAVTFYAGDVVLGGGIIERQHPGEEMRGHEQPH
ncbi:MAG: tRNA 2-thiouridine(34) synthase MnmA [Armatimonadota bacterium]|nr:tRNA 2-thiouridine(34) synthase MnmA [Armatimonadota bacterium]MDR7518217.1 tRNA 2-thiouridine(34) synthase MnmA [Armatimonadota bacterium]MDR7550929.1 tRNA 2-thiouridine(34) synthase MnmA [Armatimonadota bacterium]